MQWGHAGRKGTKAGTLPRIVMAILLVLLRWGATYLLPGNYLVNHIYAGARSAPTTGHISTHHHQAAIIWPSLITTYLPPSHFKLILHDIPYSHCHWGIHSHLGRGVDFILDIGCAGQVSGPFGTAPPHLLIWEAPPLHLLRSLKGPRKKFSVSTIAFWMGREGVLLGLLRDTQGTLRWWFFCLV